MEEQTVTIDKYRLGSVIGTGAFSKVYLCEEVKSGQKFAIKVFESEDTILHQLAKMADPNISDLSSLIGNHQTHSLNLDFTFQNECLALLKLSHPNIVQIHDFSISGKINANSKSPAISNEFTQNNGPSTFSEDSTDSEGEGVKYIVMNYVGKGELFDYIYSGCFSYSLSRFYFKRIMEILNYVHSQGIAHRDIKAENFLLNDNFDLVLADFGFAEIHNNSSSEESKVSSVNGSISYMAPEMFNETYSRGEKVDIFAAGVVLFVMLFGTFPFKRASRTDPLYKQFYNGRALVFWNAHLKRKYNLQTISPQEKQELDSVKSLILKMFDPQPSNRPNISELLSHSWLQYPIPSDMERMQAMSLKFNKIQTDKKNE